MSSASVSPPTALVRRLVLCLLAVVLSSCVSNPQRSQFGLVSRVQDGDSVHLQTGQGTLRVRLAAIDAPELSQAYGRAAKKRLQNLALDKNIEARCHKTDRYDRHVCVLMLDGNDLNLAMLEAGMAWHYKRYADEQTAAARRAYSIAEQRARDSRIGLWGENKAVAPWDYRRRQ